MQPNNEKITQIINDATETLMRQVLPELIAAGATPDQVVTAARAVGIFKQAREGEMVAAFPAGLVATPLRSTEDLVQKDLQEQYIELAKEYDEQAQLWEADNNRLLAENQALLEQLQASLTPHNGYSTKPEEDEELSPREAARERIRSSRRRLGEKTGFGTTARGRR